MSKGSYAAVAKLDGEQADTTKHTRESWLALQSWHEPSDVSSIRVGREGLSGNELE